MASSSRHSRSDARGSGRVFTHQRDTNDLVPILGSGLLPAIDDDINNAVHDTIAQGMNHGTRRNYRNRIARIIKHYKENFPEYYRIGVRELTTEEMADRTKYHFDKKEDLIYTGLNVQFLIYFLSSTETNAMMES